MAFYLEEIHLHPPQQRQIQEVTEEKHACEGKCAVYQLKLHNLGKCD